MAELMLYRGYQLIVDHDDILAVAPNGDVACFYSMASVRTWVSRHRKTFGLKAKPDAERPRLFSHAGKVRR